MPVQLYTAYFSFEPACTAARPLLLHPNVASTQSLWHVSLRCVLARGCGYRYPQCLFFLEQLQDPHFQQTLAHANTTKFIEDQQVGRSSRVTGVWLPKSEGGFPFLLLISRFPVNCTRTAAALALLQRQPLGHRLCPRCCPGRGASKVKSMICICAQACTILADMGPVGHDAFLALFAAFQHRCF